MYENFLKTCYLCNAKKMESGGLRNTPIFGAYEVIITVYVEDSKESLSIKT